MNNTSRFVSPIVECAGDIYLSPCPPYDDLKQTVSKWQAWGVKTVISLLEPPAAESLGILGEQQACEAVGIHYVNFPMPDHGLPESKQQLLSAIAVIDDRLTSENGVLIHCRAGIGRTGLVICGWLIQHGYPAQTASDMATAARSFYMPETLEQYNWLCDFGVHRG